ncbi:MAG TPA: NAD(P)H-dependent glycerol-3-phosphate dehydrogenase [Actinomycetota bacterium]|nr:NAD(P)H-dependent glycerol-3-phosphate dehydrogenase [Actinomycetota bacterium]
MARITVFGAGTMGTAFAMHAARLGLPTSLWANEHDLAAYSAMRAERRHPLLREHLPASIDLRGPNELPEAAHDVEVAVLGANHSGARSLARMVREHVRQARCAISVAKGLEPGSGRRMSEVYAEELDGPAVVVVGGPCLARELADGLPTAAIWAAASLDQAEAAGKPFDDRRYQLTFTDDVVGVELCSMMKNVAAIGLGILDGLGKATDTGYQNAKAALFTRAAREIVDLVTAGGGRPETPMGLAGIGDQLVTSLGGRNRLYGELVGAGDPPDDTLDELEARGLTVEGVDSTRDVHRLAEELGLELPYHEAIHRVLFEEARPDEILEVLR